MTTHEKIKNARERLGLSKHEMAQRAGMDLDTYKSYESGHRYPSPDTLLKLAACLSADAGDLAGDELGMLLEACRKNKEDAQRGMFDHDRMYTYIKGYASAMGWNDAIRALAFARQAHSGQTRKSGQPYIVHPLTVASHALALGIREESVITASLLHDVCEDCGVLVDDLPVDDPVAKDAVRRLTHVKGDPLGIYYREVAANPTSSLAKLLDRCDNVSTMAGVFTTGKLLDYIKETRDHVMPLWRETKDKWPQYSTALFVLKYHIVSVIDGLEKCVDANNKG